MEAVGLPNPPLRVPADPASCILGAVLAYSICKPRCRPYFTQVKHVPGAILFIGDSQFRPYFHSRQSATPPKMPDSLETIFTFGPGSNVILFVFPPPMYR